MDSAAIRDKEIVKSVRRILLEVFRLEELGIPASGTRKIVREAIFHLYEGGEKKKWAFDRPHSAAARALHEEAKSAGKSFSGKSFPVTYDHCIPFNASKAGLRAASSSDEEIQLFLDAHITGVVITKEEDGRLSSSRLRQTMPKDASPNDKTARYLAAGIQFKPDDWDRLLQWPNLPSS